MDIQNRNNNEATNKALAQELTTYKNSIVSGAEKQRERHISRGKPLNERPMIN